MTEVHTEITTSIAQQEGLNRRQFLQKLGVVGAGGLTAAIWPGVAAGAGAQEGSQAAGVAAAENATATISIQSYQEKFSQAVAAIEQQDQGDTAEQLDVQKRRYLNWQDVIGEQDYSPDTKQGSARAKFPIAADESAVIYVVGPDGTFTVYEMSGQSAAEAGDSSVDIPLSFRVGTDPTVHTGRPIQMEPKFIILKGKGDDVIYKEMVQTYNTLSGIYGTKDDGSPLGEAAQLQ